MYFSDSFPRDSPSHVINLSFNHLIMFSSFALLALGLAASAMAGSVCDSSSTSIGVAHGDNVSTDTKSNTVFTHFHIQSNYALLAADSGDVKAQGSGPTFSTTEVYCGQGGEIHFDSDGYVYCSCVQLL